MKIHKYLTTDEQLLVRDAEQVPAAKAILNAAAKRRDDLQKLATKEVGNVTPEELQRYLLEASALDNLVRLPDDVKSLSNKE